jgi:hypothetical protein
MRAIEGSGAVFAPRRLLTHFVALACAAVPAAVAQPEASLQAQIDAAVAAGQHAVTIRPGVYRCQPLKRGAPHVRLRGLSDLAITADGVTLLCGSLSTALWIENCRNLSVHGLTIDYDPLPLTQGTIVGLAPDHSWTDVKIHAGYSDPHLLPPGQAGHLWVSDRQTRQIKVGVSNRGYQSITPQGDGVWRLNHGHAIPDTAAVGDYIRMVQQWDSPHGVLLYQNEGLTLEDFTVQAAPGFGIVDRRSSGDVFRRVRIVPGPPPAGATEPRLFSSWADGLNCAAERLGPKIEDGRFENTGDDAIALYYESNLVVRDTTDTEVVLGLTQYSPPWRAGDKIRFFHYADGTILDRTVVAAATVAVPAAELEQVHAAHLAKLSPRAFASGARQVTLDAPVTLTAGDMAANWSWRGEGFEVARNEIVNGGSRGIVVNASGGAVRANRVTHTVLCGIHMFAFAHAEGGPCFQQDVQIEGNTVTDACVNHPWRDGWLGAICVCGWDPDWRGPGGHRDIRIVDNEVRGGYGVSLQIHDAAQVLVRGNVFRGTQAVAPGASGPRRVDNAAVVLLDGVDGAILEGNRVIGLGAFGDAGKLVVQAGGTREVKDNRAGSVLATR